mmetsp:Transcript_6967/g.16475  ORF Transcript_6967/g.16475 Transcript_6967/m.16475 type:complete len:216 (-) Transcript_6967:692-1339(-)
MVLRASVCAWLPANVHCWWDLADGWQKLSIMVGTTCALVASLISAVHFSRHACNAAVPSIKFCTLKIVFMVPFFSVDAVACLLDSRSKYQVPEILTFLREFYEAVVLVAFLQLVLNCLGGSTVRRTHAAARAPLLLESGAHFLQTRHPLHPSNPVGIAAVCCRDDTCDMCKRGHLDMQADGLRWRRHRALLEHTVEVCQGHVVWLCHVQSHTLVL